MSFNKKLFYRIFPTEKVDFDYIKFDTAQNKIYVRHLQDLSRNAISTKPSYWEFQTDGIFFNMSQESVYQTVEDGLLKNVINGYNAVILSFGQTGCGKTFTSSGLHITESEFGFLPRIAHDLIELKKEEPKNIKISIEMSYVEFYNRYAVDLLNRYPRLIEISKCREVRRVKIRNELDALKCIFLAEGRKSFIDACKYLSNLATSVATFHIVRKNMDFTNPKKVCSRLHVIDMAGNNTCINLANFCKNPKQIGLANVTKSQLEQLVLCIAENISEHIRIKQRSNSLIYYLNGDFSNQSILRFIGHVKVKTRDLLVTLSMMRFGNLVRGLKMKSQVIEFDVNEEVELAHLRDKLKSIEKEKLLNSILFNQDLSTDMNPARVAHLNNLIEDYLADHIQEITLTNVADTKLVLQKLKETCCDYQTDLKKLQTENELLLSKQQSTANLKQRFSKTSSQSSGSKLSRKSSKVKSMESISKDKAVGGSFVSDKKNRGSEDIGTTELSISSSHKRKKSNKSSTSGFKSGQSKRKSSTASIEKRDSKSSVKSSLDSQLPVPHIVPARQEMWKRFSNTNDYKDRVEEYKQNEREVRICFTGYVREVSRLQNCRDVIDKHHHELLLAQTFRKFNSKDEFDANGMLILSFAEKECKDRLEEAQDLLGEQQEKALTAQEMLKVHLENRRSILKRAEEEFDQFCTDNFQLPAANVDCIQTDLNAYTFDANLEQPYKSLEQDEESVFIPEVSNNVQIVIGLQKMMSDERNFRKKLKNKKIRRWKNV